MCSQSLPDSGHGDDNPIFEPRNFDKVYEFDCNAWGPDSCGNNWCQTE